jgi:trans-2-enoyl-CoA reductase
MLRDFVPLNCGDTLIQNASNSGVGQAAIQMAAAMGVNSICLLRDRDDFDATADWLSELGATLVLSEGEARTPAGRERMAALSKPKLALNCVGGKHAVTLLRNLEQGGTMVTYGGMSKQPVTVPTGLFIFNDVIARGFWMTRWNKEATREKREAMLEEVADMIRQGTLTLNYETHTLWQHELAVANATTEKTNKKQIFLFS